MSNPPATIIWQDLRGGMVMDNSRYDIISDVAGVRLNFTDTNLNDNGQWTCSVAVAGQNITVSPNSEVISMAEVGREEFEIEVFVVGKQLSDPLLQQLIYRKSKGQQNGCQVVLIG